MRLIDLDELIASAKATVPVMRPWRHPITGKPYYFIMAPACVFALTTRDRYYLDHRMARWNRRFGTIAVAVPA